ncbi:MULE domain-containing protein [Trichonephila clavipes]|nr:MULE domain-containing protein [Trichonephila clavipes]
MSVVLPDNVSVVLSDNESVVLSENQSVVFSGNSDFVVNDMGDCANDYSVAESDFVCPDCLKTFTNKCHRSGNFVSDSKGLRCLKILGSNKINANCPAALKVTQHTDGKCVVSYQKIHIGHQNDIGHLFLTADERKIIASKIAAKIPLDNILDEITNSISDARLERVHLLTKKRST